MARGPAEMFGFWRSDLGLAASPSFRFGDETGQGLYVELPSELHF